MHRRVLFMAALLLPGLLGAAFAGDSETGAAALDQALADLSTDFRVACLAARAEDVDWATLAYLRRVHGVRTAVICFSRSDGSLLRSAAEVGAGYYRLDLPDHGFSRSGEETLERWSPHRPLEKLGKRIREFLPDLLFVSFSGEEGDGRRDAVETLARQTFGLAPTPDFQVSKLYFACAEREGTARADVLLVDPVRGVTYFDLGGATGSREARCYRLVDGRVEGGESGSLLDGLPVPRPEWLDTSFRLGSSSEIRARLTALRDDPGEQGPPPEKVHRALTAAYGLKLSVESVLPNTDVSVVLRNGGDVTVTARDCVLTFDAPSGGRREIALTVPVAPGEDRVIALKAGAGDPAGEAGVSGTALLTVLVPPGNTPIRLRADFAKFPEATGLELSLRPWGRLLLPAEGEEKIYLEIANPGSVDRTEFFTVRIEGTDRVVPKAPDYVTVPAGGVLNLPISLEVLSGIEEGEATIECACGDQAIRDTLRIVEVGVPGELEVGVVTAPGGAVFDALLAMGMRIDRLTDEELLTRDLLELETILIEPGAFALRPALGRAAGRLLEFVEAGGHLVVFQPHPSAFKPTYSPFALVPGQERVCREDADILQPDPDHRLLHFPNRIRESDFSGWVRERGRGFPESFDAEQFVSVLQTSDPGRPLVAGLLIARYGQGSYVHSALSWQDQLKILNPAALKMIANLVSLSIHR